METIDKYGESACENAMRIHENPEKGNRARASSISKSAGMNQKIFAVYRRKVASGR
jgi:hypothetical protein